MHKKLFIIIAVVLAIIAGASYLILSPGDKSAERDRGIVKAPSQSDEVATAADGAPKSDTSQGAYVDYSPSVVSTTAGTKLLFFHAPWCRQCRALEADIRQQGVPAGVTIIKVDYDSNQALRQRYGVTLQTTVVKVDDAGEPVEKYVAYDEPTLASLQKNLLQ